MPYTLEDLSDPFIHMSNHCIQEHHPEYGKYEPTNEMWWHEFAHYLATAFADTGVNFFRDIMPQVGKRICCSAVLL